MLQNSDFSKFLKFGVDRILAKIETDKNDNVKPQKFDVERKPPPPPSFCPDCCNISRHLQLVAIPAGYNLPTGRTWMNYNNYASVQGVESDRVLMKIRKRSWSRSVFSSRQRAGLEKRFQEQKYIMKPDRKQLADNLGLTDAQVKVWFQNRRMKWRNKKKGGKKDKKSAKEKKRT